MKLWTGRLPGGMDASAARLNSSLGFDRRLGRWDVEGSKAWAKAIQQAGVLSPEELNDVLRGLDQIGGELESGQFAFHESDEDIHTAVERRLTELVGEPGQKLHTGRSRNDQVATDFRLWMMDASQRLSRELKDLQETLLNRAQTDFGVILPGYTHLQQAQPILLSHWWLSYFWALQRDRERLQDSLRRLKVLPLGSGALAGTSFPIDRGSLSQELGFDHPFPNSLDAVSDRDFVAEFHFWASLVSVHLSRLAETLIIHSTTEFGFITLDDSYSTGSSLMPQKKNPDPLELIRGKSGGIIGRMTGWFVTWKGLPSTYDKDLQEDKPGVFETCDQLEAILPVFSGLLATLEIHEDQMKAALAPGIYATDLADYLVKKGVPFRQAHSAVAQAVRKAESLGISLSMLPLNEWQSIAPAFSEDLFDLFDPRNAVDQRAAIGGTARDAVQIQLTDAWKSWAME